MTKSSLNDSDLARIRSTNGFLHPMQATGACRGRGATVLPVSDMKWDAALPEIPNNRQPKREPAAIGVEGSCEMRSPPSPQTIFSGCILALGLFAALYVASSFIFPVVLAFMLNLLLQPVVDLLGRLRLPRVIGALLVILVGLGTFVGLIAALSVPAATWAQRLPEGIPRLEARLVVLSGPIQALQNAIQQVEQAAGTSGQQGFNIALRPDMGLTGALLAGARAVLDGLFTTVLVLYFLLVSGNIFLRRIVEILPRFSEKRQAVDISQQIEKDISAYLLTVTAMNVAVGCATATAMYLCGLGDPLLWGATAFLLNYIPILGPLFGTGIFFLAGMLSFDSLEWALLPPALYFGIHLVEGETLTPMLLARRFTLNPVLIILSLVFWFWMWGIPGAVLAVPMLAILKIICDRVGPLTAVGRLLEG